MDKTLKGFPKISELKKIIMHTSSTVWKQEITEIEIDRWLDNFKGEVHNQDIEKLFALWLLANFVYYNEDEVRHLCKVLMGEFIHKSLIETNTSEQHIEKYLSEMIAKTYFLPLGKPSESGGYILYYFRQENNINISSFVLPSDISIIDNIVVIDDVTLTAGQEGQAYRFLRDLKNKFKNKKIFLLTLIAGERSIEELKKMGVEVITAIILDNRNKCFCKDSYIFHSYPNYIEDCKKIAFHYGNKINSRLPLGYMGGEYIFGFFYNTPDNTLPIFWGTENGWQPIFMRIDKNYEIKYKGMNERFL